MAAAATSNRSGRQPVLDVSPVAVLAGGHAGTIRALLLVPGAGYLVSAASDRVVKVWDYTAPAEEEPAPTTTTTTNGGGGGGGGNGDGNGDGEAKRSGRRFLRSSAKEVEPVGALLRTIPIAEGEPKCLAFNMRSPGAKAKVHEMAERAAREARRNRRYGSTNGGSTNGGGSTGEPDDDAESQALPFDLLIGTSAGSIVKIELPSDLCQKEAERPTIDGEVRDFADLVARGGLLNSDSTGDLAA